VGGLITEHWSWRWIFYVNIPVGIIGFVGAQKVLRGTFGTIRQQFDLPGAVLFAAVFAPLTLVLSFASEWGWVRGVHCFASVSVWLLCWHCRLWSAGRLIQSSMCACCETAIYILLDHHDSGDAGLVRGRIHSTVLF